MWVLGAGQQAGAPSAAQIKSQAKFRMNTNREEGEAGMQRNVCLCEEESPPVP